MGLCVEHGKGIFLVLHTHVQNLVIATLGPQDRLVEPLRVENIRGLQAQGLFQKGEGVMIPSAQNDVIYFCCSAVFKMDGVAFYRNHNWFLCYLRGPLETHWFRSPTANNIFSTVLETLESYIFCRIASTNSKNSLALILSGIPEIVRVDDTTRESVNSRQVRHVRNREVPSRHYDVVEPFSWKNFVLRKVFDNH